MDIVIFEVHFLPVVESILNADQTKTDKQRELEIKSVIEYYEVFNEKKVFYPLASKHSESEVKARIEGNFGDLLNEFECPICSLVLDNPYTTKCGHTFCKVNEIFHLLLNEMLSTLEISIRTASKKH